MNGDDAGEWLTYAEVGQRLGISTAAARQLSRRRNWPRRTPNEYGAQALIRVPAEAQQRSLKPHTDGVRVGDGVRDTSETAFALLADQLDRERERADRAERHLEAERERVEQLRGSTIAEPVTTTDPLTVIGMQTLSLAVEMLREDVERERERADQAERQVEVERQEGRKRIDELQGSLADERQRIDGLYTELADARTAAMISGCEAAALRFRLELLTERRRWWRRWFRG